MHMHPSSTGRKARAPFIAASLGAVLFASAAPPPAAGQQAQSLPSGGTVTAGEGGISQSGATLTVTQRSQRMIADWQSFSVGSEAGVHFSQPNADAVALNRVLGADPSSIQGSLTANGKIFLVNPNGVVFGQHARVDTGGIVASSLGISNEDFLAGRYNFTNGGGAGDVSNEGRLSAAPRGYVVLAAPKVRNRGSIDAPAGSAALAAGDEVRMQVGDTGLLDVQIGSTAVDALIENHGAIRADDGSILLRVESANAVPGMVMEIAGTVQARGIDVREGRVFLDGGPRGEVHVEAIVDASSQDAVGSGGEVTVLGEKIALHDGSRIDASGTTGGGTVLVGGNWQGQGPQRNADAVVMAPEALIEARATQRGDGGTVVLWSEDYTNFSGSIDARGGAESGIGGDVETSSHGIFGGTGRVDASGPQRAGRWLLDPVDITIASAGTTIPAGGGTFDPATNTTYLASSIGAALTAGNNVTIQTGAGSTGNGDITLAASAPITKTGGAETTLTLRADRNIALNSVISSTSGKLNVLLNSRASDAAAGTVTLAANITTRDGNLYVWGGSGATPGSGAAATTSVSNGVLVSSGVALNAGGGHIGIWAASSGGGVTALELQQSTITTTGTGDITLSGVATSSSIGLNSGTNVVVSAGGNLSLLGSTTTGGAYGLKFGLGTGSFTAGGNVSMTGTAGSLTGIGLAKVGTAAAATTIAAGGNVTLTGRNTYSGATSGAVGIQFDANGALNIGAGAAGKVEFIAGVTSTSTAVIPMRWLATTAANAVAVTAGSGGISLGEDSSTLTGATGFSATSTVNSITAASGPIVLGGNRAIDYRGSLTTTGSAAGTISATPAGGSVRLGTVNAEGAINVTSLLSVTTDALSAKGNITISTPIAAISTGALTGTADISLTGSSLAFGAVTQNGGGLMTFYSSLAFNVTSPITKNLADTSTLTLRSPSNITVNSEIKSATGAGPLNVNINARYSTSGSASGIVALNQNITTNGGNLDIWGTTGPNGTLYATINETAFVLDTNRVIDTGGGSVRILAYGSAVSNNSIVLRAGSTIRSTGASGTGDIVIEGDSFGSGHGISLADGVTLDARGNLSLRGRRTSILSTFNGIMMGSGTFRAGGNLYFYGGAQGPNSAGIQRTSSDTTTITSTGGNVQLDGVHSYDYNGRAGIRFEGTGALTVASSPTGSLTINGTTTSYSATGTDVGIQFGTSTTTTPVSLSGGTGGVALFSSTTGNSATGNGLQVYGTTSPLTSLGPITLSSNRGVQYLPNISTTAGDISANASNTLTLGNVTNAGTGGIAFTATSIVSAGNIAATTGAIRMRSNALALTGTTSGTGTLALEPYLANGTVGVGSGTGTLTLPASLFDGGTRRFADGFSSITIGRSDGTGAIAVGSVAFTDPVSLLSPGAGGSLTFSGLTGVTGGSLTGRARGAVTLSSGSSIQATGDIVLSTEGTGAFENNSALATPLNSTGGRWIVYSNSPTTTVFGTPELISGNAAVFGSTYATVPPASVGTGNRYVFNYTPAITVTTTSISKIYGDDATAAVAAAYTAVMGGGTLNGLNTAYTAPTVTDILAGQNFNVTSTGSPVTANVGASYAIRFGTKPATLNGVPLTYAETGLLSVTARPITIASNAGATKLYGQDDPSNLRTAYSLTGGTLVNGHTLVGNMGRAPGETVGSYVFTRSTVRANDGNNGNNYVVTFDGATNPFSITTAPLTATIPAQTKIYGNDDPLPGGIAPTLNGLVSRSVTSINGTVTPIDDTGLVGATLTALTRQPGEAVGSYDVLSASVGTSGAASANYGTANWDGASTTLAITPRPMLASMADQTKVYGDDDPDLATIAISVAPVNRTVVTWNGGAPVDDSGLVAATVMGLVRDTGEDVGTYDITGVTLSTPTGTAAANYSDTAAFSVTPHLGITARALTATMSDQSKIYGDDDPAPGSIPIGHDAVNRSVLTWNGSVAVNDTDVARVEVSLQALARAPGETVSRYGVTGAVFAALAGSAAANYIAPTTLAGSPALDVHPRSLTASIANPGKVYGDDDPALSAVNVSLDAVNRTVDTWNGGVTVNDSAAGQLAVALQSLGRVAGETVGTYAISGATFQAPTGTSAGNYTTPSALAGSPYLAISTRPLTAGIADLTKVYGGDDPALSSPVVSPDAVNRDIATWNGIATVDDSAASRLDVTLTSLTRDPGEDVGPYAITGAVFGQITGDAAGNYSAPVGLSGSPRLLIGARPLAATIADQAKVYGEDDPAVAGIGVSLDAVNRSVATWNGTVAVDDSSPGRLGVTLADLGRVAGETVGTRSITAATFNPATGSAAGNYLTPVLANTPALAIAPAPLTGSISNQTKIYGEPDPAFSAIGVTLTAVNRTVATWDAPVAIDDRGQVSATLTGLTRVAGENVGNYAFTGATLSGATGSAAANYGSSVSFTGSPAFSIVAREITLAAQPDTRVYDGSVSSNVTPLIVSGTLAFSDSISGLHQQFDSRDAGPRTLAVDSHYVVNDGYGGANYAVTLQTAPGSITPKPIAAPITVDHKTYDGSTTATGTAGSLSGLIAGDIVNASVPTFEFADRNAGIGKPVAVTGMVLSGTHAGNYDLVVPSNLTANISRKLLGLTGVVANDRVYDATTAAALSAGTLVGIVGGDVVTLVAGTGTFANKNVGTNLPVTATGFALGGADAANYDVHNPTGLTATIAPAPLAVINTAATAKVYDGSLAAPLDTSGSALSGQFAGDVLTLVTAGAAGSFADRHAAPAKPVSVSGFAIVGADAGNYVLSQPLGLSADITPRPLPVAGVVANNKVFDGNAIATLDNSLAYIPDLIGGDDVTLLTAGSTATFDNANAGNGKPVTAIGYQISGAHVSNYLLEQPRGLAASINPLPLFGTGIVGTTALDKVYDGTTAAMIDTSASTMTGLVNGFGDVTLVTSAVTGAFDTRNVGNAKTVTITGFTLAGNDANNYSLPPSVTATANITPLPVGVVGAVALNKTYDATRLAVLDLTNASSGFIAGDSVALGGTPLGEFADKNVGSGKSVSVTGITLTGLDRGNYSLSQPTGLTANITPASVAVIGVVATGKIYDGGTTAALSAGALNGVLGSDMVALDAAARRGEFLDKNVAIGKTVVASNYALTGVDAPNYRIVQPTGLTATIAPAPLFVSGVTANDKIYDATTDAAISGTPVVGGVIGPDVVTVAGSAVASFADKNVGDGKAVTVGGYVLAGADAANYAINTPVGLTANITPAAASLTGVRATDKVYDTTTSAVLSGGALRGVLGADSLSFTQGSGQFIDKTAGSHKPVVASGFQLTGLDAVNYRLAQPDDIVATITPATLTLVGAAANDKIYDATDTAVIAGGTLSGVLPGDSVTAGVGSGRFVDRNAGNGKAIVFTGYAAGGADAANYVVQPLAGLTANITPAALSVSATTDSRVYDGTTASGAAPVFTGLLGADTATATQVFATHRAGTGIALQVADVLVTDGNGGANYQLIGRRQALGDITPKALTLTGIAANDKTYDATTVAVISGNAALVGVIANDTVQVGGNPTANFADRNVGSGKMVSVDGFVLQGADAANYSLTAPTGFTAGIRPAALTVNAVADSKDFDGNTVSVALPQITGLRGSDAATAMQTFDSAAPGIGKRLTPMLTSLADGNGGANYAVTLLPNDGGEIKAASASAGNDTYRPPGGAGVGGVPQMPGESATTVGGGFNPLPPLWGAGSNVVPYLGGQGGASAASGDGSAASAAGIYLMSTGSGPGSDGGPGYFSLLDFTPLVAARQPLSIGLSASTGAGADPAAGRNAAGGSRTNLLLAPGQKFTTAGSAGASSEVTVTATNDNTLRFTSSNRTITLHMEMYVADGDQIFGRATVDAANGDVSVTLLDGATGRLGSPSQGGAPGGAADYELSVTGSDQLAMRFALRMTGDELTIDARNAAAAALFTVREEELLKLVIGQAVMDAAIHLGASRITALRLQR